MWERSASHPQTSSIITAYLFVLPLIKLWAEVFLLGHSFPLGGGLLVRQQDEGNIRVCAILGTRYQCSVSIKRSHPQRMMVKKV